MSGWKLVPVEPTREQMRAAVCSVNSPDVYDKRPPGVMVIEEEIYGAMYEAMLDAAPPPAADAVSVEVIDGRVWIIRGVQRWMLAYDDAEHAEWYAGTLRAALAARDAK
jgi:hypothetical protein